MPNSDEELRKLTAILEVPKGTEWEAAIKLLLRLMGENPQREGLRRTPLRVKQALQFLTAGYRQDPKKILTRAVTPAKQNPKHPP